MVFPQKLSLQLADRKQNNTLRSLPETNQLVDFLSNDYLGLAQNATVFNSAHQYLIDNNIERNGSTGSRLISGNHDLYATVESYLAEIHEVPSALVFNSGYVANLGLLSCIAKKDDFVFYDKLSHASIRDGLQLSQAKSIAYVHNDLQNLEKKLIKYQNIRVNKRAEIYVVTESVFSMDGDSPDFILMTGLCQKYQARLIVDEAHGLGVYANGLLQELNLHHQVFARVMTFGKAMGCHGAAILGSQELIEYLFNYSRPFIYTTAMSPHALATILCSYAAITPLLHSQLHKNICLFKKQCQNLKLSHYFIDSDSAIQSCVIADNLKLKSLAQTLKNHHFNVKPILYPTVPQGHERLRICLHSFNSCEEINQLLLILSKSL